MISNIISRYPFATANGDYIPADILRVQGSFLKNFTVTATTAEDLPVGTEILRLRPSEFCWFFNGDGLAVAPVHATPSLIKNDTMLLLKDEWILIAINPNVLKYSVIRDSIDGVLNIQVIQKWNVLALDVQTQQV